MSPLVITERRGAAWLAVDMEGLAHCTPRVAEETPWLGGSSSDDSCRRAYVRAERARNAERSDDEGC